MKMKNFAFKIFLLFAIVAPAGIVCAQDYKASDILGVWMNQDKDANIEIYQDGDKFFGKLVWLKNPIDEETGKAKLDNKNSDPELQKRPISGLVMLKDFTFDGDDEWEDGSIYDPKKGSTYSCYMQMQSMDKLKIRGYIGVALLGRTTYWTRVKKE
jgi:uncharacterized protein (DUF2147 family)